MIYHYLSQYGYFAIFIFILLEDFGMPVPGETALIAAAILAAKGHFSIIAVGLLAFLGAVIGDNIGYAIGFFGGRRLVLRYGRYVLVKEKHIAAVERFFARYGNEVVTIARFVNGPRQLNGLIAGIGKMPWYHFLLFNIIGAALWVGIWGGLAYAVGRRARNILSAFSQFQVLFFSLLGMSLLTSIVFRAIQKRTAKSE